jgi:hypothetical protein
VSFTFLLTLIHEICISAVQRSILIVKQKEVAYTGDNVIEPTALTSGDEADKEYDCIRDSIQKFPDWPPVARTANRTGL